MMDTCRFYENSFPNDGDLVVIKVMRVESNLGAYVRLLEYEDLEGLILPTELSKRRFRSINKLVKVGKQEVVMVIRIDKDKGYVDLSKKRVSPKDVPVTLEHFAKGKKTQLIVKQVATRLNKTVREINEAIIWPLYKKHGHAYNALVMAQDVGKSLFDEIDCAEEIKDCLMEVIRLTIAPNMVKLRVRVSVSCSGSLGILAIKETVIATENMAKQIQKNDFTLKIQLISSPVYVISVVASDRAFAMSELERVLEFMRDKISSYSGGSFQKRGGVTLVCNEEMEESESESSDSSDSDEFSSSESDDSAPNNVDTQQQPDERQTADKQ